MNKYNVKILPSRLYGSITAPPSKSISHRALICAALTEGESIVSNVAFSDDILATIDALKGIGAGIVRIGDNALSVNGVCGNPQALNILNCRESGSTLRFMIPVCLLSDNEYVFSGSSALLSRPLGIYEELFPDRYQGVSGSTLTLSAGKPISSGEYHVKGNVSSQFISGLLFALPLCRDDSRIVIEGAFESASYVDMTLEALRKFGVNVTRNNNVFYVKGGQKYFPSNIEIEGDASLAAFFDALNYLDNKVEISGLNPNSIQGDMAFKRHFETLRSGSQSPIDLSDCPDLAPILFSLAALFGETLFVHTKRLRYKESNRIVSMKTELEKFGARLEVYEDSVRVLPSKLHAPTLPLNSHNDHRVAMSLAILCTRFGGVIEGAGAVCKSMPDYFEKLIALGANIKGEIINE